MSRHVVEIVTMTMLKRVTLALIPGVTLSVTLAMPASARVTEGSVARKGLSGSAELGYISYDTTVNGRKLLDASSFVQKYSLLYTTYGRARTESIASYNLAVGYEWNSIDVSVRQPGGSTDQTVRSGRFLYDGSFTFNPPQSPILLSAYSRDMNRNSFSTDTLVELSGGDRLIAPNMPTDLNNSGTNIDSGISLVIADKKLGRNRFSDLLDGVPAIYVDYRDMLSRNTEGHNRLDARSNRLNVSAGGMGSTWLHYRSSTFADNFYPANNYTSTKIQIGTINQYRRRSWVQFSNWIKLSADASFEQTKYGAAENNEEEFDLNIFATAQRRLWQAKLFSNYNRKVVGGAPSEELRLPLYVSGVFGAGTDWSMNVSTKERREGTSATSLLRSSENVLSARINTFKRHPFTLSSTLSLTESSNSAGGGDLGADLSLETVSTSRFARNLNLAGSYALRTRYNRGSEKFSYNQDLKVTAYYQPSSDWKLSFLETLTQGKNDEEATHFSSSQVAQGQNPLGSATNLSVPSNNFLRLSTTLTAAWTPVARFSGSVSGTNYVQIEDNGNDSMANAISASITYTRPTYNVNMGSSVALQDTGDRDISAHVDAAYRSSRDMEATLRGQLNQRVSSGVSHKFVNAAQRLTYYIWGSRGVSRKVADLYEELTYTQENGETANKSLTLAGTYYVYARISLNGRATYSLQDGTMTQTYGAGLAANMKLLDATVDYTYAKRASDKRVESRLAATLKKTF